MDSGAAGRGSAFDHEHVFKAVNKEVGRCRTPKMGFGVFCMPPAQSWLWDEVKVIRAQDKAQTWSIIWARLSYLLSSLEESGFAMFFGKWGAGPPSAMTFLFGKCLSRPEA